MGKYKPGQVWTYETREGEESSRLTVVKVEQNEEFGCIVHVFISNLAIKSENSPGGVVKNIHHAPFIEEALDESVTELESKDTPLPEFQAGYREWKAAFDNGDAGVFSFVVADGIAAMEAAMQEGV